jgi:hypothetical protein
VPVRCLGEESMRLTSTLQVFFFLASHEGLSKTLCSRSG